MTRTMIVAGVNLDRAWTDLGPEAGGMLRDWSRQVLAHAVGTAGQRGAELLVVLGGLVDRSTAVPDSVDFAVQVLGSFPGRVLVVPGPSDWTDGTDLYALTTWASNTTVAGSSPFEPLDGQPAVWVSAWTSPVAAAPRLLPGQDATMRTLFRAGLVESERESLRGHGLVCTTGAESDGVLGVPDLVRAPGVEGGWGVLVDLDDAESEPERVVLPPQPGGRVDLDVSGLHDAVDFADALAQAAAQEVRPLVVALTGSLASSILLPGFGGPDVPAAVVLDLAGLKYAVEVPDAGDRTTRAEFLRAMAITRGDERERHQTTALGLRALDSSAAGA